MTRGAPIRVLSLNIEGAKHVSEVQDLIRAKRPDVVCLQEVQMPEFISRTFANIDGIRVYSQCFGAMGLSGGHLLGVATLWKMSECMNGILRYSTDAPPEGTLWDSNDPATYSRVLAWVHYAGVVIANTHFAWTPDGSSSEVQRREVPTLRRALDVLRRQYGGLVCAGDFNAPRGKEIYAEIMEGYRDYLPPDVDSTLDPVLHRTASQNLRLAVDTIFGTQPALEIELISGISDHIAILATIAPLQKKEN